MQSPGEQLEALCRGADQEIVLATPFVKFASLKRLLENIPFRAAIKCVTRWRLDEIAAGVSDIEIWKLLKGRPSASLWLRPDLHAKFYRADDQCLVGSANLTGAALGWSYQPNLELLVSIPFNHPVLVDFERSLLMGCVQVDDDIFEEVRIASESLKRNDEYLKLMKPEIVDNADSEAIVIVPVPAEQWLPTLRHPEKLYLAYIGALDDLSLTSRSTALRDLMALPIPLGMSRAAFEACVGTLLLQKPTVHQVDAFVTIPRRFGEVADFLKALPCAHMSGFDAARVWQTLMRWLRYFLPKRYSLTVPNHTEIFVRTT